MSLTQVLVGEDVFLRPTHAWTPELLLSEFIASVGDISLIELRAFLRLSVTHWHI